MLVTTPSLDDTLLPDEQVLFRSSRSARPATLLGSLAIAAVIAGYWFNPDVQPMQVVTGFCFGLTLALLAALTLPKAQVLITDRRLLIRVGLLIVRELVTHLGAVARVEKDDRDGIEIVCRDGERTRINELPSLARMIDVLVARTGVDSPVILPTRLKPWGWLARLSWGVGALAFYVPVFLAVGWVINATCDGSCDALSRYVGLGLMIVLFLPSMLVGGAGGLIILLPILRVALPVNEVRMVFEAVLLPPKATGRFDHATNWVLYFPALSARYFASRLYGEEI